MKKFCLKHNFYSFLFIFLLIIVSIVNLRFFFQPGIFRAHDIENHLARIANYYLAIKDGHIPPRWAKNLNHKFGYPVFNYNYPLANILAYPLIVVGFGIEDSLKIILFSAYFFSGLFFYLWAKRHFSLLAAFSGAIFYLCAPYQFLDLYVRGVVGENLSFALLPAILYILKLLSEKITRWRFLGLVLATVLFSLSHNIMVLIFTPLIFCYWFYLARVSKSSFPKLGFKGLILGFLTTSFFWIPAIWERKYVTLEAFNPKNFYQDHFVSFRQLIYSPWQYGFSMPGESDTMSFQIGIFHWLAVLFSIAFFIGQYVLQDDRTEKRTIDWIAIIKGSDRLFIFFLLVFWLAVFLMLPSSLFFWRLTPFLGFLQFPWRLLGVVMFSASFLATFLTEKQKILGLLLTIACFVYSQQFVKPFFWEKKPDINYYDFLFTTSTRHENKPIWFSEENINKFKSKFTSDSGLVTFKELVWKTGKHIYEINTSEATYIWEHTAYFPGWQVFVDGQKAEIKYDDKNYPGIIGFKVPTGRHQVITKFTETTPGRIIGDLVSILTLFLILRVVKFFPKK